MFCRQCGKPMSEDLNVCPVCGYVQHESPDGRAVIYAISADITPPLTDAVNKSKKNRKILIFSILSVIAVISLVIISLIITNEINKNNLKNSLMKEWYATDDSIIKVLDIQENQIDYRLETSYSWLNSNIATFDWEPINGNQIKLRRSVTSDYDIYTIEFHDEYSGITVTPAITSADSQEIWVYLNK